MFSDARPHRFILVKQTRATLACRIHKRQFHRGEAGSLRLYRSWSLEWVSHYDTAKQDRGMNAGFAWGIGVLARGFLQFMRDNANGVALSTGRGLPIDVVSRRSRHTYS